MTLTQSHIVLDANMKDGRLHGISLGHDDDGTLAMVGLFVEGRARGPFWQKVEGGGFLYGRLDKRGAFSGNSNAFIYPDMRTAMRGRFKGGDMVAARACQVVDTREQDNVLHLVFSDDSAGNNDNRELFTYAPSTLTEIRCPRMRRDPLETTTVRVGRSTMGEGGSAGEGLFAARALDAGETVAYYNGIRVRPGQTPEFRSIHYEIYVDWCHLRGDNVTLTYVCT